MSAMINIWSKLVVISQINKLVSAVWPFSHLAQDARPKAKGKGARIQESVGESVGHRA